MIATEFRRTASSHPLRDWAELVRIPNTFTTVADILAGFAIASGTLQPTFALVASCVASIALYWSGMVLNDVHDVEADRAAQRRRPISDGRIPLLMAVRFGIVLLLSGCLIAGLAGWNRRESLWEGDSLLVATLLASSIVAYDSRWKSTFAGPILMGLCRGLNLLLGIAAGGNLFAMITEASTSETSLWWLLAPLSHTTYVAGFTLAARRESTTSRRSMLVLGWSIAAFGIFLWGCVPWSAREHRSLHLDPNFWYPVLLLVLALPWLRRVLNSVQSLQPIAVQPAVKQSILTLIFLDAAAALAFAGPSAGIATCLLVFPMSIMGIWFRST